jgi:hypothetical protein
MLIEVGVLQFLGTDVQVEVELRETELPHAGGGRTEIRGRFQFSKELGRQGRVRLVVTSEERERLLFPTPVLENLRRQLHKVPSNAYAGEGFDFDLGKDVVQ